MSFPSRSSARIWILILLCAAGFFVWASYRRIERVEQVTKTDGNEAVVDAASPTGYAGGKRWLIVPEHNNRSYQWIAETQQMWARREWRVRHIDYENAPSGRAVHSASPYRWWLGLIAWSDHSLSHRPLGLAVERAALWADPLLLLLLLVGTTVFVARQFGNFAAALFAAGMVMIFPFAGNFLPGVPGDQSLTLCCALGSVLPLLAAYLGSSKTPNKNQRATHDATGTPKQTRRLFFWAGVAGGLGLWISAIRQVPLIVGVAAGALLTAWIAARGSPKKAGDIPEVSPWRIWALGGASACLLGYLIEYFPAPVELRLQVNHPLYGLAWLGLGELLLLHETWLKTCGPFWTARRVLWLAAAAGALLALPVSLALSGTQAWFIGDQLAARLTNLPNGVIAKNFAAWVARDGASAPLIATCLPLLLLVPALWQITRRQTGSARRMALALALGPIAVVLVFASLQLAWWSLCDALLLTLLVVLGAGLPADDNSRSRGWLAGFAGLMFLPGLIQLIPPRAVAGQVEFTRLEVEGLLERSLAHWIADRAGPEGAIVLLPPDRTPSWSFHGGWRGIGTGNWENRDGLAATIQLVSATTAEEARAQLAQRGITHIVLPSWDSDLDAFVSWTLRNPNDSFLSALHHWALPAWLRPLPYQLPAVAGFENQSVAIFQVTDESNKAAALSRLAEFFIETQQLDPAGAAGEKLKLYPADLGALVALAQVERARGDMPALAKTIATIVSTVSGGFDRSLPWDRRVSLAVVLAQAQHDDLAREQVRRCLDKIDETRIRSLSVGALFRLQVLAKAYGSPITDPKLRELAVKLVPPEVRSRL